VVDGTPQRHGFPAQPRATSRHRASVCLKFSWLGSARQHSYWKAGTNAMDAAHGLRVNRYALAGAYLAWSMPFFLQNGTKPTFAMLRSARVVSFTFTKVLNSGTQMRLVCRLGS